MMHWQRVGLVGGGQLGRMLALAGQHLGLEIQVLAEGEQASAAQVVAQTLVGRWDSLADLGQLAQTCSVITFEHEWVNAALLQELTQRYPVTVWPSAQTLGWIQDKYTQRCRLQEAGLPVPQFQKPTVWADILTFAKKFGPEVVLKTRYDGYDGRGTFFINPLAPSVEPLPIEEQSLLVEERVPFIKELAVMVARTPSGRVAVYPVVETQQVKGVCHTVIAPAAISEALYIQAQTLAVQAVEAVEAVGVVGVELFLCADGGLFINELAPRPHNSGHYTIEGCVTSQFEQHLRAILDWPLGDTTLRADIAVMVNILGESTAPVLDPTPVLALGDVHLHWYGKMPRPGRKLGHITVLGEDRDIVYERAQHARILLKV